MKRAFKWLIWGGVFTCLVLSAMAIGAYSLMRNTVAPVAGEARLAQLSAEVSVLKDKYGIPHIEAENRADVMRALGWVHASERIWQMEVLRMAAQGRLSEMFGDTTVPSDRFLKVLGLAGHAEKSFRSLREDSRELLEAYAEGVNAWLNRERSAFEPQLPVEFIILSHLPEEWQPWHSIAVLKVMALTLDANMDEEIGRLALAGKGYNARQIEEIYPAGPRDRPPLLPDLRQLYGFGPLGKEAPELEQSVVPEATAPWQLQLPASNNWVIAGSKSESGKPLLANDPHLGFTVPSTFYLAHLRWRDGEKFRNLVGGSLPGTPLVLSGRNDHLAWGLTTTYLDSQDLFVEQIMPGDPSHYRTENGSFPFREEELVIRVKGDEDVTFTRRMTRHGPVLPDGYKKLKERLPEGHVAALSWTALSDDDTTYDGIFDISIAASVDAFFAVTKRMTSPMQSVVVADTSGDIGIIAPGRVPVRSFLNSVAGRAPVPGWRTEFEWQGFLPPERLPMIKNPDNGVLGSANAKWLPDTYQEHITYDWVEPYRQDRLEQLFLSSNGKQSLKTMMAGQADTKSLALERFRDEALQQMPQGVRLNEEIQMALEQWDGRMDPTRPEPLILAAWHRNLLDVMLRDDLMDDFELVAKGNLYRTIELIRSASARNWCNKVGTPENESCGMLLFEAAEMALAELGKAYGKNWRDWRWGDASRSLHEHRPFTSVGVLSPYFTIRQEMAGGKYTLLRNSNDFSKDEPYAGHHGAALRAVYDFADLENSRFMISTGQSGNVFSPHYKDLAKMWGRLEYVTIPVRPETYRKSSVGVFTLSPANDNE